MSYTLYHGCIESAIEPIINGEYGVEKSTPIVHPWLCANGKKIFFYDKELVKEDEGLDDDEDATPFCIERCNGQAQIQNACLPQPFNTTCVLEIIFYCNKKGDVINSWEDICVPDWSCENMSSAVCMDADMFNQLVKEGKVGFKVHKYQFFPKLALCYITSLPIENPLFNKNCLAEGELKACKFFMDSNIYIEELYQCDEKDYFEILPAKFKSEIA